MPQRAELVKQQHRHHQEHQPHHQQEAALGALLVLKLACPLKVIADAVETNPGVDPLLRVGEVLR